MTVHYNNNIFYKTPNFQTILSSFLYDLASTLDKENERSSSYIKILLEMSLYFCYNMDISKYSLAELYSFEKHDNIALKKLDGIKIKSFFSLASDLKKLTIIKDSRASKQSQG